MTLRTLPRRIAARLELLVRELLPPMLFFFVALLLILLMFKLFVAQYTVEFLVFTKAALGAVIVGKAVLVMEWAEGKKPRRLPLAIVVIGRTAVYAVAVIVLGTGERLLHAVRETRSFERGLAQLVVNASIDRFLGLVILISLIIGVYLALEEIDRAMGPGQLRKLFLSRPSAPPELADQLAGAK